MKSILIVEDSPSLDLFYQKLFEADEKWKVYTCYNFDAALEILDKKDFDYIISDGYVENSAMTGLDFLKISKIKLPDSVRLYVSGTIMPKPEDYSCFNAFINKKDLQGEELLNLINCIDDETLEDVPDHFFTNVFLS